MWPRSTQWELAILGTNFPPYNFELLPIILGNNVVDRVPIYKLLGVYISDDLRWNYHIDYIFKKSPKRLFSLRVLRTAGVPSKVILKVYLTNFRMWCSGVAGHSCLPFPISLNQFRGEPCPLNIHTLAMRTPLIRRKIQASQWGGVSYA